MFDRCPECRYDLSGLGPDRFLCPECGAIVEASAVTKLWSCRLATRWKLFFLSPIMALPGTFMFIVGQPVLSFILSMTFAYRAIKLDSELYGRDGTTFGYVCQALSLSFAWTTISTSILGIVATALIAAIAR